MAISRPLRVPSPHPGELLELLIVERFDLEGIDRRVYLGNVVIWDGRHPLDDSLPWLQTVMDRAAGLVSRLTRRGASNDDQEQIDWVSWAMGVIESREGCAHKSNTETQRCPGADR